MVTGFHPEIADRKSYAFKQKGLSKGSRKNRATKREMSGHTRNRFRNDFCREARTFKTRIYSCRIAMK
jgi:hypothetical protein